MFIFARSFPAWCAAMIGAAVTTAGQPPASAHSRGTATGPTQRTLTIHWDQVPLREAIARLSNALDFPVWLDRRIDPVQRVSLDVSEAAGPEVVERLASELSLGASQLDAVAYVGPRQTAQKLRTAAALRHAAVRSLPASQRRSLEQRRHRDWPRLTEPRDLVTSLLRDYGWRVRRTDLIPHDLWPAGELPAMSVTDQLTLLLAGFDLTFQPVPDQRAIEIKPLENRVTLLKRYPWRAEQMPGIDVLRQQLPDADLRINGQRLMVDGRLEDHERLLQILARKPAQTPTARPTQGAEQRYTLRVENQPVGEVLRQLAQRLHWNLIMDEAAIQAAGRSLDEQVSFTVEDASLERLLEALLRPVDLTYQREGQQIAIVPSSPSE